MKITYSTPNNRITVEVEAESQREAFAELATSKRYLTILNVENAVATTLCSVLELWTTTSL